MTLSVGFSHLAMQHSRGQSVHISALSSSACRFIRPPWGLCTSSTGDISAININAGNALGVMHGRASAAPFESGRFAVRLFTCD